MAQKARKVSGIWIVVQKARKERAPEAVVVSLRVQGDGLREAPLRPEQRNGLTGRQGSCSLFSWVVVIRLLSQVLW